MKSLIIKQNFFDQIKSGQKKIEYRKISIPNYLIFANLTAEIEDTGSAKIKIYVGYNKNRANGIITTSEVGITCLDGITKDFEERYKNFEKKYEWEHLDLERDVFYLQIDKFELC